MGSSSSKPPNAIAEDLVEDTVKHNQVVIFSKRTCGYSDMAKHMVKVESKKIASLGCEVPPAVVIELDDDKLSADLIREVQGVLVRKTGSATVPQVFVNHTLVGGGDETVQYARSGGLRLALMKASKCTPVQDERSRNEA